MSQRPPLFRQQALDFRQQRQWGEVIALQPLPIRLLFLGLAVMVVLLGAFLAQAQYARKETVPGYLAPKAGLVRVFPPRPGTVEVVHVAEGQLVAAGQPLLTVAVDQTTAGGANVDLAVLDALARQKALLAERLATQEQFAASERLRLQAQIDGIRAEVAQFEAQIATQAERVRLAASRVSSTAELRARGVASDAEYKQRRESQLEQQGIHGALVQDLIARRSQLTAVHQALGQLPIATAEKLQLLRNEVLETEQRIAEIEGRRGYVLRAPAAGLVSALQATAGRAADPRQPQLSLLPEGGALQAELFVPTRAAGFLRPGQEVRILYDAFPYQRFGTYRGRLLQVSQTVLMGADISAPIMLQEPAYRATVELERQSVDAGGSPMRLQPDMLLRADIVLDRRPLLVWLLDPLLRARIS